MTFIIKRRQLDRDIYLYSDEDISLRCSHILTRNNNNKKLKSEYVSNETVHSYRTIVAKCPMSCT